MKLKKVQIHKYKSFELEQTFDVQDDVTILVGMNESGKTSVLESIAKTNYFLNDKKFKFNKTHDYPRREKKGIDKTNENPKAITCEYEISDVNLQNIAKQVGKDVFVQKSLIITTKYDNNASWENFKVDFKKFIEQKTLELKISSKALNDKLEKVKNEADLEFLIAEYKEENLIESLKSLKKYFTNSWKWENPIQEYVARVLIKPLLPKFLYYDEYYSLPSRIVIEKLEEEDLGDEELKTARALLELADLTQVIL